MGDDEKKPEEENNNSDGDQQKEEGESESQKSLNSQAKALPWVREMSQKLSAMERKEKERQAAEEKAQLDKETKALEEAKKYDEAAEKRAQAAVTAAREKWEADKAREDKINEAKMKLILAGVKNEKFIKAELTEFDPDQHEVSDFVQSVLDHPDTAPFITGESGDTDTGDSAGEKKQKGTPFGNKSKQSFSPAKLKEWANSSDPEKKQAAIKYKEAYWDKHGSLPPDE